MIALRGYLFLVQRRRASRSASGHNAHLHPLSANGPQRPPHRMWRSQHPKAGCCEALQCLWGMNLVTRWTRHQTLSLPALLTWPFHLPSYLNMALAVDVEVLTGFPDRARLRRRISCAGLWAAKRNRSVGAVQGAIGAENIRLIARNSRSRTDSAWYFTGPAMPTSGPILSVFPAIDAPLHRASSA